MSSLTLGAICGEVKMDAALASNADPDGLKEILNEAIESSRKDAGNAFALILAAEFFVRANRLEEAVTIAHRAIDVAPSDYRVLRGASGILAEAREHKLSAALCARAVELAPFNAELHLHYGVILLELRENRRAIASLEAHLKLEPDSAMGWRNVSSAYCNIGEFTKGLKSINRAIELNSLAVEFRIHKAGLLNHLGRSADAVEELRAAEEVAPEDATVKWLQSNVLAAIGDFDAAVRAARLAVSYAPDRVEFREYLESIEKRQEQTAAILEDMTAISEDAGRGSSIGVPPTGVGEFTDTVAAAARKQLRIIAALLIREAVTRFGESKLGYAWAFIEPVSHLALIATVFTITNHGIPPIGDNLVIYYFTGVSPYLLFNNTIMHVQHSINSNRSLLQIPIVTHVDVILARGLLELLTQSSVVVIIFTVFYVIGLPSVPRSFDECAAALFTLWVVALGIGATNCVIMHFIKSWDHVFANVLRALYFCSGVFLSPQEMPAFVRDVLSWNPLLQAVDWYRNGFYANYQPDWLSRGYVVVWALTSCTLGLCLERAFRRRLTVQ